MKTAEEWIQTYYATHTVQRGDSLDDAKTMPPQEQWVKAIQLDALREAAEIARIESEKVTGEDPYAHNSILARVKELEK